MINRYLNTSYRMKNLFLIAMVLFTSCATPPRITYEGERNQEGKYHGEGVITYSNGEKWEGEFKDGEPYNGQGTYTYPDSSSYKGEFKDGLLNGRGIFITPDGFSYDGDFKGKNVDDIKHFLISSSGTRYDGVITRGTEKLGFGIFTVKSHISSDSVDRFGNRYEGEFKGDVFHGQGIFITLDGIKYVGENKDGKKHGQGTIITLDGKKYVGEWKDDKPNGQGTMTFPDGAKYVGEFKDGNYNGQGTMTFPDGAKYVGEFKDSKKHGQGTNTFADGGKYVGEFKNGKYSGQGTYTFADGGKYVGEFKNDKYNGQGTYTWANGRKYVGEWKDGLRIGQGTLTFPSGTKYVGEFKNDKFYGKGVLFKGNGEIQSGTWVNDIFQKNWTIEAVDNFLRNQYPQFTGLNYSTPITSVPSQNNEVYLPPSPDNPSFIAVVDFTGNNVSEGDCRALIDRLRAELFNTKHYKVIEREMMEEIIKEQGFQQSGCSTEECMVQVGKLIGVEKIVGGSISKVGRTYSVSSRIVSVETGKILKGATYDYKGEIDELLTTGMRMVAYELIND
jgi:TolB-like protein